MAVRLWRWYSLTFDLVLTVALEAVGQVEIFRPGPERLIVHPAWNGVIWVLAVLPMPWRRRWPWLLLCWWCLLAVLEVLPEPNSGTIVGFVLMCIAVYSVARYDGRPWWIVGAIAVALLVLVYHYSRDPAVSIAQEAIQGSLAVTIASGIGGRLVRDRHARTTGLEVELSERDRRQQDLARAAVAAERARIARELHDVIAHSVSVAIVQSVAAQADLDDDRPVQVRARVEAIEETARQALADMRRLVTIGDGDPEGDLDPQPGLAELPALLEQLRGAGLIVGFSSTGPRHRLPVGADLALYRIVQEAMTNVLNHAPGAAVEVIVARTDERVDISVVNGPPTGPDHGSGGGRGLVGMRERAHLYDGTFTAGPTTDGGFAVRVGLPDGRVSP